MATWRLFALHPPLPAIFSGPRRWLPTASTFAGTRTTTKSKMKKKNRGGMGSSSKPALAAAAAAPSGPSPDYLTRRTRSDVVLDRCLYRRYAEPDLGHVPVMLGEVLDAFRSVPLRSFVDCTLGAAGHSAAIIENHREMELYVGLDVDPVAYGKAKARIEALLNGDDSLGNSLRAYTHVRNFKYIKSVLGGIDESLLDVGIDGILMDLGISSMQVDRSERGFSVLSDGPLDMRMNPQAGLTAADILNTWPEAEVGKILRDYGEESNWSSLGKLIVRSRSGGGLQSTKDLVDLIRTASPRSAGRQGWMKTATRVFQALRIAVNDELQTLEDALYSCFDCLSSGGRLLVISFHSLEDRIVKQTFLDMIEKDEEEDDDDHGESFSSPAEDDTDTQGGTWSKKHRVRGKHGIILTKRPITPSKEEEKLNRRCRSAKLRVIQKI